ncbi:DMT family transporter [Pararhodobacter sp.]|uniref:DMT family transporter n=1 Tax=Pararhodobacter sp. TaxID=2127056 RepID=UPI002AFEA1EC|nr:DMT family transporter [Pararhodobacter sp.]
MPLKTHSNAASLPASPLGPLFALLGFGIYSTHDVIVKYLGETFSVFQIMFFSGMFSFPLIMGMLMRDRTPGTLRAVHPWWSMLRMVTVVAGTASAFYAFTVLPLAQTYTMLFAAPILITILSIPLLGERVGLHRGLAVALGLMGVIVVLRPGAEPVSLGHLAGVFAAFGIALSSVIMRKIGRDERSAVLMLYPMLANLVIMGLALPFVYQPMELAELALTGVIAAMAFVAALLIIAAYRLAEAAVVAPMQYSQILWATVYGVVLFSETPDAWTLVGAALIIVSGLYIVFRETRRNVSSNRPVSRARTRMESVTSPNDTDAHTPIKSNK